MPFPTALAYLGVALEATKGTAEATADAFVPVNVGRVGKDVLMQIDDNAGRGIMADGPFDQIAGPLYGTFEIPSSPVFPDTFPWFLVNILGDYATTGAGDPFTHTAALKNDADGQCKSLTLFDFYGYTGTHTRRYPGMQVAEVSLEWNADGMLMHSAKLVGFASDLVAKPSQSFSTETPHPAWECVASIGGAGNVLVEKGSLSFKRDTGPIHTADGTQAPYKIWQGGLVVEGALTLVAEDDAEYLRYLNSTKPAVNLKWSHGATERSIQIVMSKCNYKDAGADRGKKWMSWEAKIHALPNTTDVGASGGYSQVEATFLNALPANTYA